MRTLTTVNLVSNLALRVVHQNLSLTSLNEHHERGNQPDQNRNEQRGYWMHGTSAHQLEQAGDSLRQPCRDTRKDNNRNTVAQAALGNLLAEPHQKHSTGQQRYHRHQPENQTWVWDQARLRLDRDRNSNPLK